MEVPIVVYCLNPLVMPVKYYEYLTEIGFKNVREYKLGILGGEINY